jgi:hypothetical protein
LVNDRKKRNLGVIVNGGEVDSVDDAERELGRMLGERDRGG